jgi:hypothetical protein
VSMNEMNEAGEEAGAPPVCWRSRANRIDVAARRTCRSPCHVNNTDLLGFFFRPAGACRSGYLDGQVTRVLPVDPATSVMSEKSLVAA